VANSSQCVRGFDRLTFIQGTTTNAFNAWFIDEFYNIPIFVKRGIEARQQTPGDITIPPEQAQNPLVQLVNTTASSFDQTFNDSLWATYANPFANYNEPMDREYELLLVRRTIENL
jgi:lysophospholipase